MSARERANAMTNPASIRTNRRLEAVYMDRYSSQCDLETPWFPKESTFGDRQLVVVPHIVAKCVSMGCAAQNSRPHLSAHSKMHTDVQIARRNH